MESVNLIFLSSLSKGWTQNIHTDQAEGCFKKIILHCIRIFFLPRDVLRAIYQMIQLKIGLKLKHQFKFNQGLKNVPSLFIKELVVAVKYISSLYHDGGVTLHSLDFRPETHINLSRQGWTRKPNLWSEFSTVIHPGTNHAWLCLTGSNVNWFIQGTPSTFLS